MDREALLIVEVCMCVGICCFLEQEAHIAPVYSAVYINGDWMATWWPGGLVSTGEVAHIATTSMGRKQMPTVHVSHGW